MAALRPNVGHPSHHSSRRERARFALVFAVFLVSALAMVSGAAAGIVTLDADADTYVRQGANDTNEGASTFMQVRDSGNNRGLVRFDQTAISTAVGTDTLLSATLELDITENFDNWSSSGRDVSVHRMIQAWAEGNGFVHANSPSDRGTGSGATWRCAIDTDISNSGKDCSGTTEWEMGKPNQPELHPWVETATDTVTITNGLTGTISFDVTADVQAFLAGTETNDGWLIRKDHEGQSGRARFSTKENNNPARLVLDIDTATDTTPPTVTATGPFHDLDGQTIPGDQAYDLTIDASDGETGVERIWVEEATLGEIAALDADCTTGCPASLSNTFNIDTTGLPDGTYTYTAHARDEAGNENQTASWTISVQAPVVTEEWTITDLGVFPGGATSSSATDINNAGQVVGFMGFPFAQGTSFLWDAVNGFVDIGKFGGRDSIPHSINDNGEVVGQSAHPADTFQHAYKWTPATGIVDLGTIPGGRDTRAFDINDNGDIVGEAVLQFIEFGIPVFRPRAVIWPSDGSGPTDLGLPVGPNSASARGINNRGEIVISTASPASGHILFGQGSTFLQLDDTGEAYTPNGISEESAIAGRLIAGGGVVWDVDGRFDLAGLGPTFVNARDVNASDTTVGDAETPSGAIDGFVDRCGVTTALTGLLPAGSPFTQIFDAQAINDHGQIVGQGRVASGAIHAYLLEPPATVCMTARSAVEEAPAGTEIEYSVQLQNVTGTPVTLNQISVTLPAGFVYEPDTTIGITEADPLIVGQQLTWAGPFTLDGSARELLEFAAVTTSTVGTYTLDATANGAGVFVIPADDVAEIDVVAADPSDPDQLELPLEQSDEVELASQYSILATTPQPQPGGTECSVWSPPSGVSVEVHDVLDAGGNVVGQRVCFYNNDGRWTFFTDCISEAIGADPALPPGPANPVVNYRGAGPGYVVELIDPNGVYVVDDWRQEIDGDIALYGGLGSFSFHRVRGTAQMLPARTTGTYGFMEGNICAHAGPAVNGSAFQGVYAAKAIGNCDDGTSDPAVTPACLLSSGTGQFDLDVWFSDNEQTDTGAGPNRSTNSGTAAGDAIVRVRYRWRIEADRVDAWTLVTTYAGPVGNIDSFVKEPKFRVALNGADPTDVDPDPQPGDPPRLLPDFTRVSVLANNGNFKDGKMRGGPPEGNIFTNHSARNNRRSLRWDYGQLIDSNTGSGAPGCAAGKLCFRADGNGYPAAGLDTDEASLDLTLTPRKWESGKHGLDAWAVESDDRARRKAYPRDTREIPPLPSSHPNFDPLDPLKGPKAWNCRVHGGFDTQTDPDDPNVFNTTTNAEQIPANVNRKRYRPVPSRNSVRRWEVPGRKQPPAVVNKENLIKNPAPYIRSAALFIGWQGGRGHNDCELLMREFGPAGAKSFGNHFTFRLTGN